MILTSRGNARQKVFFTDADRQLFLKTLSGVVSRYQWICHAYRLMANHYHLLVKTPKGTAVFYSREQGQSINCPEFRVFARANSNAVRFAIDSLGPL
jgi:REP element-mobilizing transposase RayT